ncbi:caspase domain-containing protein [Bradyrhizobium sp. Tv2a-2]|uniref:caspase family protein n=1 Tax=Bradyrhizobium sp. Tv2a-2 TaxID=113395 RepID=UPI00041AC4D3|nr:caspase domain-containing protein [Bradyrhizobium sp. Tv2a-2]
MRLASTFRFKIFPVVFLSLLLTALAVYGGSAAAEEQEKRIALVVGDGAYGKAPLATAANDAGLMAQTLQAAGFDVIGARDLDGDTLRKSLRDFIQKAESSGRNTVAIIYLAGYGVQLAGENYFIPVDSNITRDPDIPIEGLRISDYTRQLASIPLKASVVVLDAARQQPFIEGGAQQIASGLALVEAENNMLIAFNAAPGTVAPTEPGPYGVYAQSLAEMIRTGGLSLPDVFDRVRLRVNESSKGAQVPWDDQKIQAQFAFFDRAPDAPPAQGPADQVAAIRDRPIREMSAHDAYAAALERDTLQGYEDFVLGFPADPLAKRVRAIIAARREAITWRRTYRVDSREAYWSYLRLYPQGPHAWDARRRLTILVAPLEPPPSFAMLDYDVPPPPPEEIVYVDRPVLYFGDPDFAFAPPPPPPVFLLPPPPPDFVVLTPPFVAVGLFILPQPRFVPMPVFVRPPVYVAPPPNNVIFNNIHNTTVINNVINVQPAAAPAGNVGAAAAGAGPQLPQSAQRQATLIQQGRAPMPQSAVISGGAKASPAALAPSNLTPTATPTIAPQNALPGSGSTPLPQTSKGTGPGTATTSPVAAPSAKLAPTTASPSPSPSGAPTPGVSPAAKLAPTPTPLQSAAPAAGVHTNTKLAPSQTPAAHVTPSPAPSAAPKPTPKPTAKLTPPTTPAAPKPSVQHAAPPAPSRPMPPPVTAHAPPPSPHPAPPPPAPVAHAAPPPPPRPAAPPPPRPAAAKKCPPNQPKC